MESISSSNETRWGRVTREFSTSLEKSMLDLEAIWDEVGILEEQKLKREQAMIIHFQNLLKDMVSEEENLRNTLKSKNAEYYKDIYQLCNDLGRSQFVLSSNATLLLAKAELREIHDSLAKTKGERLNILRKLRLEEEALCKRLSMPQHDLNFEGCPKDEQLKELEQNITFLDLELVKRNDLFSKYHSCILHLWDDLCHEPKNEFENQLTKDSAQSSFTLSSQNLEKLNIIQAELEGQHQDVTHKIDTQWKAVTSLWKRMDVSDDEQSCFKEKAKGHLMHTLESLNKEEHRLEELKRIHMEKFIGGIRKELSVLWDKCFYGDDQRKEFQPAFNDEFTQDALNAHEHQVRVMQDYYEENKLIFKKVEKREAIWKKKVEFETREKDVNRLNNRGGALLKEETIRKVLEKELPKVEQEIAVMIQDWEKEHETYLLINGTRYLDAIETQKEQLEILKGEKRLTRQQAKYDTLQEDITHGSKPTTPLKRHFAGTPVRSNAKHRKIDITMGTPGRFVHSSICPSPRPLRSNTKENASTMRNLNATVTKNQKKRRSMRKRNSRRALSDKNSTVCGSTCAAPRGRMPTPRKVPLSGGTALKDPVRDVSLISYSEFVGGVANDGRSSFVAATNGSKTPKAKPSATTCDV